MSPDWALPARAARFSWLDVAAVAMVLVVVGILVPPAIHASRFHSRLASCQDGLRQVGLALRSIRLPPRQRSLRLGRQRTADHGRPDSSPNCSTTDWRPTTAGRFAPTPGWPPRRFALVAARVGLVGLRHRSAGGRGFRSRPVAAHGPVESQATTSNLDWSGTWRNGTIDGATDPPPAAVALLADAPSADLPGQTLDCHDGQGRNMFFEDGHVDFLPCSTPRDAAETILSQRRFARHAAESPFPSGLPAGIRCPAGPRRRPSSVGYALA